MDEFKQNSTKDAYCIYEYYRHLGIGTHIIQLYYTTNNYPLNQNKFQRHE